MAKVIVRMICTVSGTRDGAKWPAIGELLECPYDEAMGLVGGGLAVPYKSGEDFEQRPNVFEKAAAEKAVMSGKAIGSDMFRGPAKPPPELEKAEVEPEPAPKPAPKRAPRKPKAVK